MHIGCEQNMYPHLVNNDAFGLKRQLSHVMKLHAGSHCPAAEGVLKQPFPHITYQDAAHMLYNIRCDTPSFALANHGSRELREGECQQQMMAV